ncbi:MAG: hypothetical protein ACOCV3_02575 [Halanaerobiales bacterium]
MEECIFYGKICYLCDINVTDVNGATVTTEPDGEATAGTEVTVNISDIVDGKQFSSIEVTGDDSGNDIDYTEETAGEEYTFDMPDEAVTAEVTLEESTFAGGDGSDSDPYQIENWHHLNNVRDNLDSKFILVNDLDETTAGYNELVKNENGDLVNEGKGWDPIGADCDTTFAGVFNGNDNTISDLVINREGEILLDYLELLVMILALRRYISR